MKNKKLLIFGIVLALTLAIIIAFFFTASRYNKQNLISAFKAPSGQTVYILGTIHNMHFSKKYNYSMQDICTAIGNLNPDAVYIEAREEIFAEYGVVDGPIDMLLSYAYCVENNIKTQMIDWWTLDNTTKANTTTDTRDDRIFENINEKLLQDSDKQAILIVCGATHFHEQSKRMLAQGFTQLSLDNTKDFFVPAKTPFTYPAVLENVITDKISYLKTDFNTQINEKITDEQNRQSWLDQTQNVIASLEQALEKIKAERLY